MIDAAVAAGTLAHHEIRILSPDTKVLSDVNGQHPTGSTPFNSKRHILVPLTSTSRAKVWGVAGKSYVVTTPDGVPDGDVCMALFNGSILPSASPMNVSQLIQVVGDTIEANRSLATPASVGEVYIVVSQNDAKALLIEEPNGAGADADANFAAFITSIALPEIAKITVAANDLPVSTTGANFGE